MAQFIFVFALVRFRAKLARDSLKNTQGLAACGASEFTT